MGCDTYLKPDFVGRFPEPSIMCYRCGKNLQFTSRDDHSSCVNDAGEVPANIEWSESELVRDR